MNLTESISQAIATMEGFFKPGTIAQRNGNPGNLRSWGNRPVVDGYAAFLKVGADGRLIPDPDAGWDALHRQVDLNIGRGLSLQEFFGGKPGVYGGFSPAGDPPNDPRSYAQFVGSQIGVDPTIPLNAVQGGVSPPDPKKPRSPRTGRG